MTNLVTFRTENELGIITLSNPPYNLINMEMFDEFEQILNHIDEVRPRAILLTSEGSIFSAGIDVKSVFEGRSSKSALEMLIRFMNILNRFEQLPMPTLAAVQGNALTAGFELILACDMVWAADVTNMGLVEAEIGTTPMGGGVQRLHQRLGHARTCEIIMGAGLYSARRLEEWNVINRVLPIDDLMPKALAFSAKLAKGPTLAHCITKKLCQEVRNHGIDQADKALPTFAAPLFESQDMVNGIKSFLENGPGQAEFVGR